MGGGAQLATLTFGHFMTDVGHSFREAFSMFWDTLWALVLGFALSGAVQAFVSRERLQRSLGDHGAKAVTKATMFGMASSSCSYAASAVAKSLFAGGADFIASMVFMFASTNLVIELGAVLVVLLGWAFLGAEFVGGVIMIVLLVLVGSIWLRGRCVEQAARVAAEFPVHAHRHDGQPIEDPDQDATGGETSGRPRPLTLGGWADAAGYTMSDLTMLRTEMVFGFAVAGFLAVLVPVDVWNDLFLTGHGFATTVENVALAPLVALLSFVCSIGNIPLAAALWHGGISFGGVVSFIFADLVALPLVLIYRKQYGARMARRLLGTFWLVMSLAGLVTEELFSALGWVPTSRPVVVAGNSPRWNATTVADLTALAVLGALYWLYRHQEHFGGGRGYAKDPVCGMQVKISQAPAMSTTGRDKVYFCSEHCRDRYRPAAIGSRAGADCDSPGPPACG